MFRSITLCALAVVAIACAIGAAAGAQEKSTDQQKAMETYMKVGAPNENHAFLKNFAGKWNVTSTAWMQPGAQPSVSQGTCAADLVLGGRYCLMKFQSVMFGQPFEGIEIIGYDNTQQKYITFWIDNTGTAFYLTTGTREAAGNTINDTGLWPDPMTGGPLKVRAVTRFVGLDEYTYELFMVGSDGKEFKSLENRCVRQK
ncbi:MAG TPA: DUF1579 domain-containing protein [Candidatus Bathyarchaeia archaeon]|nr:DUF1579 domain-containing protein [Candidatus Bathyarchaeia archaeon]